MFGETRLSVDVARHVWGTEIILTGALVDDALLSLLPRDLWGRRVRFTMHGVTRFTSSGIGAFMRLLSELKNRHDIEFADCSSVVVDQFQMLEFSRYGRIVSFYAAYFCERCDEESSHLLSLDDLRIGADGAVEGPPYRCACGDLLTAEDPLDFASEHMERV